MTTLTSRERIARILQHKPVDRIGCYEHFWAQTVRRWTSEGHLRPGEDLTEHFDFDIVETRPFNMIADIAFGRKTLEETDEFIRFQDGNGAILQQGKSKDTEPRYVDFSVRERPAWKERIEPFLTPARERIDFHAYRVAQARAARHQRFLFLGHRLILQMAEMVTGLEHMFAGMALDPDWMRDMAATYANLHIGLMEILFHEAGKPDGLWFNEDLGYKEKPFISPGMYNELILPYHRKIFDYVHSQSIPIVVHSCGYMEPLLPGLIEAGMDCLQVMEIKAGMDPLRIKRQYGDRLALCGGMDARNLIANDTQAIRQELAAKIPVLKRGGGYILHSDHSITNEVAYETYRFFLKEGLRLG